MNLRWSRSALEVHEPGRHIAGLCPCTPRTFTLTITQGLPPLGTASAGLIRPESFDTSPVTVHRVARFEKLVGRKPAAQLSVGCRWSCKPLLVSAGTDSKPS